MKVKIKLPGDGEIEFERKPMSEGTAEMLFGLAAMAIIVAMFLVGMFLIRR